MLLLIEYNQPFRPAQLEFDFDVDDLDWQGPYIDIAPTFEYTGFYPRTEPIYSVPCVSDFIPAKSCITPAYLPLAGFAIVNSGAKFASNITYSNTNTLGHAITGGTSENITFY